MKGFFRGVLALIVLVSLAFNGVMYCALQEQGAALQETLSRREEALTEAQQAREALTGQQEAAAQAQAQLALVQETLEKREAQLGEMNVSLGQAVESEQALTQALQEQTNSLQAAETLRSENERLSARLAELEEEVVQATFGQEDRVQAIAALQKQLAERGELLERAQAEYARLEEQLTQAEETNAGQAVLIQESGEREALAKLQAQALQEQLDALEKQLTQAEENYGGASVTLSEQAAELEAARQQVAALERQLAQENAAPVFAGQEIDLSFALPEGMLAAEYQGAVYLSCPDAQGVLREVSLPSDALEPDLESALEQTLEKLYPDGERPPVASLENGYRFAGVENGALCSLVCVLRSGDSLLCLTLEGKDSARLEVTADTLLSILPGSNASSED